MLPEKYANRLYFFSAATTSLIIAFSVIIYVTAWAILISSGIIFKFDPILYALLIIHALVLTFSIYVFRKAWLKKLPIIYFWFAAFIYPIVVIGFKNFDELF